MPFIRNEVYRRTALAYPYGWGVRKYYGRDLIEQSGTIDGFTSYLGVYFSDSTYVVCLTNMEASLNDRCGKALAAMAFGVPHEPVTPTPPRRADVVLTVADSGRFSAPGYGTFRLFVSDGHPYAQWATARTAHYAMPIGRDSLMVRADRSMLVLERDASGRATALARIWPGSPPARFVRDSGQ